MGRPAATNPNPNPDPPAAQAYATLFTGSQATLGAVLESPASRSADWVPASVQLNGVFCQVTSSVARTAMGRV